MEPIELTLTLVAKFEVGSQPQSQGDISPERCRAIRAVLLDRVQDDEDIELVGDLLMDWSDADWWIACRCTGAPLANAPILHPRVSHAAPDTDAEDKFALVRMPKRGAHHEECPFAGSAGNEAGAAVATDRGPRAMVRGLSVLTATHSRQATATGGGAHLADSNPRGKRIPTMARVLFTLLEAGGLQKVHVRKFSLADQLSTLRDVISRRFMDDAELFPAAGWVRTSLSEFNDLARLLAEERSVKAWPRGLRAHGLIIDHVGKVRERSGRLFLAPTHGQELEVHGRVRRPGAETVGPYVAIMLVTVPRAGGAAVISQAYLHPAADSKGLLLVDSDLERKTLGQLLILQHKLRSESGDKVEIEKPYLDHYGPGIRPDFIVAYADRKVVVETMGYIGEDYAERKKRTQAEMLSIGPVLHDESPHDTILSRLVKALQDP
ncbi:protein YagA [Rothia nasimurium]|uniref:Uncharacterized protein n=1 Tax=Luteibacter anthropi TaxID=564369 RepID=A0A7X5UAE4_9GAMM|nr:hypothetical protein [Luteibacter anthropi]NII06911.1 hypothetical protein [Luteibacter anthropi]